MKSYCLYIILFLYGATLCTISLLSANEEHDFKVDFVAFVEDCDSQELVTPLQNQSPKTIQIAGCLFENLETSVSELIKKSKPAYRHLLSCFLHHSEIELTYCIPKQYDIITQYQLPTFEVLRM